MAPGSIGGGALESTKALWAQTFGHLGNSFIGEVLVKHLLGILGLHSDDACLIVKKK